MEVPFGSDLDQNTFDICMKLLTVLVCLKQSTIGIDQGLIGDSCLIGQGLGITNRIFVQTYPNGLFQELGVGVFLSLHCGIVVVLFRMYRALTRWAAGQARLRKTPQPQEREKVQRPRPLGC